MKWGVKSVDNHIVALGAYYLKGGIPTLERDETITLTADKNQALQMDESTASAWAEELNGHSTLI